MLFVLLVIEAFVFLYLMGFGFVIFLKGITSMQNLHSF